MLTADVVIGPARSDHVSPDSLRRVPPSLKDRIDPPLRFSDDGPRVFDLVLKCWVAVLEPETPYPPRGEPAVSPRWDNSGVIWLIRDDQTGEVLWTIEAADFETALREKRRLCVAVGGRSGWAHLERDF